MSIIMNACHRVKLEVLDSNVSRDQPMGETYVNLEMANESAIQVGCVESWPG